MFGKCVDGIEFSSASMAINYRIKPAFFIRDSQFDVTKLARRLTTSEQLKSTPKIKKDGLKMSEFLYSIDHCLFLTKMIFPSYQG